jgi:hypothetical protein
MQGVQKRKNAVARREAMIAAVEATRFVVFGCHG